MAKTLAEKWWNDLDIDIKERLIEKYYSNCQIINQKVITHIYEAMTTIHKELPSYLGASFISNRERCGTIYKIIEESKRKFTVSWGSNLSVKYYKKEVIENFKDGTWEIDPFYKHQNIDNKVDSSKEEKSHSEISPIEQFAINMADSFCNEEGSNFMVATREKEVWEKIKNAVVYGAEFQKENSTISDNDIILISNIIAENLIEIKKIPTSTAEDYAIASGICYGIIKKYYK